MPRLKHINLYFQNSIHNKKLEAKEVGIYWIGLGKYSDNSLKSSPSFPRFNSKPEIRSWIQN
jgi:hypothetical protein